jgi:hypothetical protein
MNLNVIIKKIDNLEWAIPIVRISEWYGSVRLCCDIKVTLNTVVKRDKHPIPKIEDLTVKLANGNKYMSIDLSHAYTQLKLHEESQELTPIKYTHGTLNMCGCLMAFHLMHHCFNEMLKRHSR